jgi:hypothetical protein
MTPSELDAYFARAYARIDALAAGVTDVRVLDEIAPW